MFVVEITDAGGIQECNIKLLTSHTINAGWIYANPNYRLNVFGFLGADSLRTKDPNGATGNSGLQDQRAAMAWVQRSIKAFGGDASRVTIDGCSAGKILYLSSSSSSSSFSSSFFLLFGDIQGHAGRASPACTKPTASLQLCSIDVRAQYR